MAQTIRYNPKITEPPYREITEILRAARDEPDMSVRLVAWASQEGRETEERAAALVLSDLLRQGWRVEVKDDGWIWVSTTTGEARGDERAEAAKRRVRETLQAFRAVQLADPAVDRFLRGMERPRLVNGRRVSVLDLVDDGRELALALTDVAKLPPSHRSEELAKLIRPTLQVATSDATCEHTGLALYDVWRYFRHTWSLEYRTTPGRSLAFLLRNAARPMAPVMGIASIANAALQLRVRDDWIGWSTTGVLESILSDHARWPAMRRSMLRTLDAAQQHVRADDLMAEVGHVRGPELEDRLRLIASAAREARTRELRVRAERLAKGEEVESLHALPLLEDGSVDWISGSERWLFKAKRAETLADLLFAERTINALPKNGRGIISAIGQKEAQRALTIAAREIRKVGLSSKLLDVNVCGAVPPYRELVVGKLVALAMASDDVALAYRRRYSGQVSEISSQVAGSPVTRSAEVSLLTTTSLYGAVSSQYNRLKIRARATDGDFVELHWRDLGLTEGWGTTHFSERTVDALRELGIGKTGRRNVNNIFGEGQSARMRQVREGLALLGLDVEVFLKHRHARRVYGLELAPDAREALRLNRAAEPRRATFEEISAIWRERWLNQRVADERVRAQIARQGPASVREELTSKITTPQLALFASFTASPRRDPPLEWSSVMPTQSDPGLIQSLYRAPGSCADHHPEAVVQRLHIVTPVDAFITNNAAGRILFITGNPGDGKTHLLKRLSKQLKAAKVDVCLDANVLPNDVLIEQIGKATRSNTRGLAVAINEGILVQLLREADGAAWVEPIKRQLLNPVIYREEEATEELGRFLVLDLNLRNNLARSIVAEALERQLSCAAPCAGCPCARGCSLHANAQRIVGDPRIVGRVARLLEAVANVGVHATMRELQGLIAFMLTAQQTCDGAKAGGEPSPYWTNAFEGGEGTLFTALRRFDPAFVTHPLLDDKLWRRADRSDEWFAPWPRTVATSEPLDARLQEHQALKRRALFEHVEGEALLASTSQIDEELVDVLKADTRALRKLVRRLNRFFDREEDTSEHLYLWMTHRYDANVSRFAAAMIAVPLAELELLSPRLRAPLDRAFPDYRPDHVLLTAKQANGAGLRVDRSLIEALLAAEHGLPTTFRRGEPEARISAFISKLAKAYRDLASRDQVQVRLVDRDTGRNVEVGVDLHGRSYSRS